ncbi:MAG: metallophosphoesterase [Armatimonadetes bacterium]|nr:metallophosphoesterase [Armatimonadota bacterium]
MRLAITSDLHWGLDARGDAATLRLARHVELLAPDVFAIAGDVGEGADFAACLAVFQGLGCERLVIPGNHDLWSRDPKASSLTRYEQELPEIAAAAGFHYLDQKPYLAGGGLALLGSINWYDYSFADPIVESEHPTAQVMYRAKLFPNGRHNDGQFVRLGISDQDFTGRVVGRFREQLAGLPTDAEQVIAIQHHPPVRELFYPTPLTTTYQRFWLAYTGNRRMQDAVLSDSRITTLICGHTHAACSADVAGKRCLNVGGDYGFKRLLLLDTETGSEDAWEFTHSEDT